MLFRMIERMLEDHERQLITHFNDALTKGEQTIMDFGCGDEHTKLGSFTELIESITQAEVIGLLPKWKLFWKTPAPTMVEYRKSNPGDFPVADKSVEAVWCFHSLDSLPKLNKTVEEFQRVMAPGALLFIVTHCPELVNQFGFVKLEKVHSYVLGAQEAFVFAGRA